MRLLRVNGAVDAIFLLAVSIMLCVKRRQRVVDGVVVL